MTKFKKFLVFGAVAMLLTLDRVAISEIPPVIFMDQTDSVRNDPVRSETPLFETPHIIRQLLGDMADPLTTPESRLFQEAMILFDNGQWAMARSKVQQILNRYSESPYAAKARFLLIDIFQELYADDPAAHYPELTRVLEEVLNRYPDSPYRGLCWGWHDCIETWATMQKPWRITNWPKTVSLPRMR